MFPQSAEVDAPVGDPLVATHDGKDVAVLFYIVGGNDDSIFKLGICNGQVRIQIAALNYHVKKLYVLEAEARANGLITSATRANITIEVINVPHVPVFNNTACARNISENSAF